MGTIRNTSPWIVKIRDKEPIKFRLKSRAEAHLISVGIDVGSIPKGVLKQLETAFEAQVRRKDDQGNKIERSGTFDTRALAEKWVKEEEDAIDKMLTVQGGFTVGFETITVRVVLEKFHDEHFANKASYNETEYRIKHLIEWLDGDKLFRQLTRRDMMKLRDKLIADKYSASSIRNYFTILTSLYKKASNTWLYPVENIASNLDLPKPNNAIQRYWAGNEKDRLMASLAKRSPWLIPIVELSLELSFRRGELVQAPVRPRKAKSIDVDAHSLEPEKETSPALTEDGGKKPKIMQGGLRWECIDWGKNSLTLEKEKNDRTKKVTEFKGRTVPLTKRMQEILRPLYDASPTKTGLVFSGTINSVSNSFHQACLTADPPIQGLTFHSLRKIATKDLAKKVGNPMMLGKLSGHKNIEVLYKRYYEVTLDELSALLNEADGSIAQRGVAALTKALGHEGAMKFIEGIKTMSAADETPVLTKP